MKKQTYKLLPILLCCLSLTGCDKYLGITPKGKKLLSTVADYDQWLNDEFLAYGAGRSQSLVNILGDNYDFVSIPTPPAKPAELLYVWASQFSPDINIAPMFWGEHYGNINLYNTVLVGIDNAQAGTAAQKRSLKAEALLGRAWEYFNLVNEYAQPYDSATADTDLAVPFVTSNDVSQTVPGRSTTADIYQHIITDITAAIEDLPADNSANRFRGSKAAAYSLLARVYFYAGNYADARTNAALALSNSAAEMLDYNAAAPLSNLLSIRKDAIFARMVAANDVPTLEYMRSFATNDLRVRKLFYSTDGYRFTTRGATLHFPNLVTPTLMYANLGTSVQEMKLMIAECAARSNDLAVALQQLDEVRKNRFAAASYVRFESASQEAVLQEVLKERYHELGFNGLRWFDMRRFDKENRMPAVNRYNAQGAVIATLEPHSPRYTLQIPVQVISFNPGMPQNP
ncbi:RagB/SusD family nutrient uptake outer membrane protein [Chitinophaga horti]|uniref:RagB/SusD family nutrient uptake outer membrane protein n=1 Tax=Chitinophaga horti TaxID=2920382 RepID=A0ABY6IYC6_9BACT|nr:RagB/SusD family nutrient uptake outer membrane protein [Chitinophaga horti]UYQ91151.1 RagB/SusD family nutrient uptake outer membrane protein [Chitinophaga horti]